MAAKHIIISLVLGLPPLVISCGSSEESPTGDSGCTPGLSRECVGPGGCEGGQVCNDEGTRYGPCDCGDGSSTGVGADGGTSSGEGGSGDDDSSFESSGPFSGLLGARCDSDADCRSEWTCVTSTSTTFANGGPAAGLCTKECEIGADCGTPTEEDLGGACVVMSADATATGYCMQACVMGTPTPTEDKCRARAEMACVAFDADSPVGSCQPTCRSDEDCQGGDANQLCDLGTGLCVHVAPVGGDIGDECTTDADCAGLCLGFNDSTRVCSGLCTIGLVESGAEGCGNAIDVPESEAMCQVLYPGSQGLLDAGFCVETCHCDDDCSHSATVCEPFPDALYVTETGRAGTCWPAVDGDGNPRQNIPCAAPAP